MRRLSSVEGLRIPLEPRREVLEEEQSWPLAAQAMPDLVLEMGCRGWKSGSYSRQARLRSVSARLLYRGISNFYRRL